LLGGFTFLLTTVLLLILIMRPRGYFIHNQWITLPCFLSVEITYSRVCAYYILPWYLLCLSC